MAEEVNKKSYAKDLQRIFRCPFCKYESEDFSEFTVPFKDSPSGGRCPKCEEMVT